MLALDVAVEVCAGGESCLPFAPGFVAIESAPARADTNVQSPAGGGLELLAAVFAWACQVCGGVLAADHCCVLDFGLCGEV